MPIFIFICFLANLNVRINEKIKQDYFWFTRLYWSEDIDKSTETRPLNSTAPNHKLI